METSRRYILAIESAISGGSLAVLDGDTIAAEISGSSSVSRAEDLLPNIIESLNTAGLSKKDLDLVAISIGPGSYTGLRIGISTVMGLCKGLGIPNIGVPVFGAVARAFSDDNRSIVLPFGRGDVCIGSTGTSDRPEIVRLDELNDALGSRNSVPLLAHSELVPTLAEMRLEFIDIGTNLAKFIGLAARDLPASTVLSPIYVQNPRFG